MSNVLLTDKDNWLLLFSHPFFLPPPKKNIVLRLGQFMIADCPIVSLIRLLAKMSQFGYGTLQERDACYLTEAMLIVHAHFKFSYKIDAF